MELRREGFDTKGYVRFEYDDRISAPGLYALQGGTGSGPLPVKTAWFTIYVDGGTGTIGNLLDRDPLKFIEDVSEFWK